MSILLSCIMMRAHRRKEKRSLCFSNKLRHTLLYRLNVKNSLMLSILFSRVSVRNNKKNVENCVWHVVFVSFDSWYITAEPASTCFLRVGNASHKDAKEPFQRILVHWVDTRQIWHTEEEDLRAHSHRHILQTSCIDVSFRPFRCQHFSLSFKSAGVSKKSNNGSL